MLRTMLSVTLTVLRGVSTRYSICIAYETIISPVIILGFEEKRVLTGAAPNQSLIETGDRV